MKDLTDLIARILIASIFLYEAFDSITHFETTKETMTGYGLFWKQNFLLSGAIFLLILGGLLVLTGYRSSFGALLLLLYWIPVTLILHSFWNDSPEISRVQSILFMKNMAIAGGLLLIIVNGSKKYSIKRLFATAKVPRAK